MKGIIDIIKGAISPVTDIVDKAVKDKDLARELDSKIRLALIESFMAEMSNKKDVLVAEITSDNWLTSNWRPLLMFSFITIIVNNYILSPYLQVLFGFSVELDLPPTMWEILKIGVGGYIVGRSGEKIAKEWKQN